MTSAVTMNGVTLYVTGVGSPEVAIGEVVSFGDIGGDAPLTDATHLKSTAREYITGALQDNDEITITCNFVEGDAGQEAIRDNQNTTGTGLRIAYADGAEDSFSAIFRGYRKGGGEVDGKRMRMFSIKPTGSITETDAP